MSTREDAAEKPLDPPMLPHETRKDNKDGQNLKARMAQTDSPMHRDEFLDKQTAPTAPDEKSIGQHTDADKNP